MIASDNLSVFQFNEGTIELPTDEDRKSALSYWWGCVDDKNIRGFKDKSLLMSHLAICFLSINEENVDEINAHLSWFIEVLVF